MFHELIFQTFDTEKLDQYWELKKKKERKKEIYEEKQNTLFPNYNPPSPCPCPYPCFWLKEDRQQQQQQQQQQHIKKIFKNDIFKCQEIKTRYVPRLKKTLKDIVVNCDEVLTRKKYIGFFKIEKKREKNNNEFSDFIMKNCNTYGNLFNFV